MPAWVWRDVRCVHVVLSTRACGFDVETMGSMAHQLVAAVQPLAREAQPPEVVLGMRIHTSVVQADVGSAHLDRALQHLTHNPAPATPRSRGERGPVSDPRAGPHASRSTRSGNP